jgi:hypothetical protein
MLLSKITFFHSENHTIHINIPILRTKYEFFWTHFYPCGTLLKLLCLSVCAHETNREQLGEFLLNIINHSASSISNFWLKSDGQQW